MSSDSIYSGAPGEGVSLDNEPPASGRCGTRRKLLAGLGSLLLLAGTAATIVAATSHAGGPAAAAPAGDSATDSGSPAASAATLLASAPACAEAAARCTEAQEAALRDCSNNCDTCDIGGTKLTLGDCTLLTEDAEPARHSLDRACRYAPAPPPAASTTGRRLQDDSTEENWQALSYSYDVDPRFPGFVAKKSKLFVLDHNDVSVASETRFTGKTEYSDSDQTRAKKLAAQVNLRSGIGPWSYAASMEATHDSNHNVKTARIDATQTVNFHHVTGRGSFTAFPQDGLDPAFKKFIEETSVDDIRNTAVEDIDPISREMGTFWARAADLGGMIRKTYTMEMTEDDTETKILAELSGMYNNSHKLVGGDASFGETASMRAGGGHMKTSYDGFGGDPSVWLKPMGVSGAHQMKSVDAIQEEWAGTFTDDNLEYPLNMMLRPVWEVVQNIDKEKGDALKEVLLAKWADETARWSPKYLLPGLAPACTDPAAANYNDLVLPGVPSEVTGCEDCCEYPVCSRVQWAGSRSDSFVERSVEANCRHTGTGRDGCAGAGTISGGRCTPICTRSKCLDHRGADHNCMTGSNRADMKCADGYVHKLRYRDGFAWAIYNFECCSF